MISKYIKKDLPSLLVIKMQIKPKYKNVLVKIELSSAGRGGVNCFIYFGKQLRGA
jgi:hypothetical protein